MPFAGTGRRTLHGALARLAPWKKPNWKRSWRLGPDELAVIACWHGVGLAVVAATVIAVVALAGRLHRGMTAALGKLVSFGLAVMSIALNVKGCTPPVKK